MMILAHCETDCFLSDPHGLQHPPLSLAPGEDLSSERPFRVAQGHRLSIQVLKSEGNAVDQEHVFEIDVETVFQKETALLKVEVGKKLEGKVPKVKDHKALDT